MSSTARALIVLALTASAACGSSDMGVNGSAAAGGAGGMRPGDDSGCGGAPIDLDAARPDGGDCQATVEAHAIEGNLHMPLCSPLAYGTNPPSSGNHYAIWAAYQTYERPFPRGFWVHSLEHGGVVITYNCPEGCSSEVADAQAFIDALPADCGPMARRVILTPDPDLDVRFAASAWGFTLKSGCFDRDAFSSFFNEHYDHAPESICGGGTDPTGGPCGTPICP